MAEGRCEVVARFAHEVEGAMRAYAAAAYAQRPDLCRRLTRVALDGFACDKARHSRADDGRQQAWQLARQLTRPRRGRGAAEAEAAKPGRDSPRPCAQVLADSRVACAACRLLLMLCDVERLSSARAIVADEGTLAGLVDAVARSAGSPAVLASIFTACPSGGAPITF